MRQKLKSSLLSNLYTVIIGLENMKINEYRYNYGSLPKNSDLSVQIKKKKQKLDLQLGSKFNYKKENELFLSLHSESTFRIFLHFIVSESDCEFDQPSTIVYPGRPLNSSESGYELNLKGNKVFRFLVKNFKYIEIFFTKQLNLKIFDVGMYFLINS